LNCPFRVWCKPRFVNIKPEKSMSGDSLHGVGLITALILCLVMLNSRLGAEVIFREDFESGKLGQQWERLSDDLQRADIESRAANVRSGKYSFRLTSFAVAGEEKVMHGYAYKESDSWIQTWFLPGYDRVYCRWYAKFAEDFDQGRQMHWCGLRGCRSDNPRSGFGRAGERPDGFDRFTTSVEPAFTDGNEPPGQMCFYTYWPDMKQSGDGFYWGTRFYADPSFFIQRGRWYCFEVMVRLNQPGEPDGEQALWVDGKQIIHNTGIRWRDTDLLKLNLFKFGLYIHYCTHDCTYWVDDLTISTDYVGPDQEQRK